MMTPYKKMIAFPTLLYTPVNYSGRPQIKAIIAKIISVGGKSLVTVIIVNSVPLFLKNARANPGSIVF